MKITVFTSSYNYAKHLRQSIESVLAQTYRNFEYHIIDYGSTDDTWEIMNEYRDDRIVKIKMGHQLNKTFAMNHSIMLAKPGYWAWCPADDYWHPSLLQTKVQYCEKYPDSVLYDDFWVVDEENNIIEEVNLTERTQKQIQLEIWKGGVIGFTGIFIPTALLKRLPFPEWENISEDYAWMLLALKEGVEFIRIPEKLHYKRNHSGSVTGRRYNDVISNMENIWAKVRE